ncbi:hypothetical protein [Marinibactrum halimedae]|uniref:Uncharacterized protein n=1 Tax=Marinibactrum halimedae TaxID=1444977 RepID=A0AA37T456_9GAMM|nr:hypothetical protein [Marinibactrum halimedae]MCD9460988.1 hypothetical protein [Marinibactrum halimedae]GLS24782.1 hypothetical protein GCM10007877_04960 [Marinibactrum halimedae]
MINLVISESVNLAVLAEHMGGTAQIASNHKRLKHFFKNKNLCLNQIARIIASWLAPHDN